MTKGITGKQAVSMMILFQLGSSLVTGTSMKADQDSWIVLIVAIILSAPIVLMYARLNQLAPGKDFFEMSYLAFGKIWGGVITFFSALFSFHLGALVIKNFTEYIQVVSLPETPQVISAVCIGLIAFFAVGKGIETLARGTEFVTPMAIFVVVFLLILTVKYMNIENLFPIFSKDFKFIINESISAIAFPFAETVLFISVFCTEEDKKNIKGNYLIALFAAGAVLISLVLGNILVLGFPLVKDLYFPSYETAGVIDIGELVSRIEVLVSGNFIIFGLTKVSICLYVACRGAAKLFHTKNFTVTSAVAAVLMVAVSQMLYENTMQMFALIKIYKYYAPFFEIALPLTVEIGLLRKVKGTRTNEGA